MNIWLPYAHAHGIEPATEAALRWYDVQRVCMHNEDSYWHYWVERWQEGKALINVEHDIVPWPGALEALWHCPHEWCSYAYQVHENLAGPDASALLGCVKFAASFIARLGQVWKDKPDRNWANCDTWLTNYARKQRLQVHQHYPPVVNV